MASASAGDGKRDDRKKSSATSQVTELKDLVVAYAKQETVDPLKSLVRFVIWGVVGAVLLAIGGVLFILAIVRAIQTETSPHLAQNLSWVPYTGGILFALLVAAVAVSRITRTPKVDR